MKYPLSHLVEVYTVFVDEVLHWFSSLDLEFLKDEWVQQHNRTLPNLNTTTFISYL